MEAAPHSFVPNPISLESRENERKVEAPVIGLETMAVISNGQVTVTVGCSTLNPKAAEWLQRPFAANGKDSLSGNSTWHKTRTEVKNAVRTPHSALRSHYLILTESGPQDSFQCSAQLYPYNSISDFRLIENSIDRALIDTSAV